MEKQQQVQKEVSEKFEIVCDKVTYCCEIGASRNCEATGHVFPSGKIYFDHCGC
ncbi:hypothetical protein [Bacillus paramycoides]|uniref:hypothetical protein n=1 Tax=Bacillus paramycoides TaxID=2026194 RepID=UPI002E207FBF|nr:hypothetical protein [Bacillus paramycoides]